MHLPEFDACPMHSALRASGTGRIKIQCACIGFVLFHSKKYMRIQTRILYSMHTPCRIDHFRINRSLAGWAHSQRRVGVNITIPLHWPSCEWTLTLPIFLVFVRYQQWFRFKLVVINVFYMYFHFINVSRSNIKW